MASKLGIAYSNWRRRGFWHKALDIVVWLFALAGFAIIGAWAVYQLGLTNNRGAVDKNSRYMLSISEMESLKESELTQEQIQRNWMKQYVKLAAFSRFYPVNAQLITTAAQYGHDPQLVDRMIAASSLYIDDLRSTTIFCVKWKRCWKNIRNRLPKTSYLGCAVSSGRLSRTPSFATKRLSRRLDALQALSPG